MPQPARPGTILFPIVDMATYWGYARVMATSKQSQGAAEQDDAVDCLRWDRTSLRRGLKITADGFVKAPAGLSKVGVFPYRTSDGRTIMELRPPEEVFAEDSLESLVAAPLTIGHRAQQNPATVQTDMVGTVLSIDKAESAGLVNGDVSIYRADAVEGVKSRRLRELSPGYTCRIDRESGDWHGQHYDQIQRRIRYNHIALLPVGAGRQGADVSLRLDSGDAFAETVVEEQQQPEAGEENKTMEFETVRVTLDGIDYDLQVPKALAGNLRRSFEQQEQKRADSADALAKAQGELAAAAKRVEELTEALRAAEAPAAIQARVDERLAVVEKAKAIAPELDCAGKTVERIRLDALSAAGVPAETLAGKSEAWVEGMFTGFISAKPAAAPGVSPAPKPEDRTDSKNEPDAKAARERMLQRNRNAWNGEQEK